MLGVVDAVTVELRGDIELLCPICCMNGRNRRWEWDHDSKDV